MGTVKASLLTRPMLILKILTDTWFKRSPVQSSTLPDAQKQQISSGREFVITSFAVEGDHVRVALTSESFKGFNTWYVFVQHAQITDNGQIISLSRPKSAKLAIPYKSQLDNADNPTGSCNVTSIAMCLEFLGAARKPAYAKQFAQFEDELYNYALDQGLSRHDPNDLAKIVRDYGCNDRFTVNAELDEVKDWLAAGKPIVTHGYFTSFGHIVVIAGYDETGFIVHDPYGEWTSSGYRTDLSGKYLHYSYGMIARTCMADGDFWVHFISR